MKAASIIEPGRVEILTIAKPVAGPWEVLLRVRAVGLCGSDLNTFRGKNPMVTFPRILGHEVGAEVEALGKGVPAGLAVGDTVTVSPYTACGKCTACRAGRPNCCRYNQTLGVQRNGAATEYIAVPHEKVVSVGGLSFDRAALIEPLSVGMHAANRGQVAEGEWVLVFGCGVIGLGAMVASVYKGARVIAVDVDDDKLAKARALGVEFTINSRSEDLDSRVEEITGGDGVHVALEAVGLPETFRKAVDLACFAGRVVYVGYSKAPVEYETKLFVSKELDVRGSRNAMDKDLLEVARMVGSGTLDVDSLVTHRFPFDKAGDALALWDAEPGSVTKILLELETGR